MTNTSNIWTENPLTREIACDICGWYAPILARFGDDPEQRCADCHESHVRYLHRQQQVSH